MLHRVDLPRKRRVVHAALREPLHSALDPLASHYCSASQFQQMVTARERYASRSIEAILKTTFRPNLAGRAINKPLFGHFDIVLFLLRRHCGSPQSVVRQCVTEVDMFFGLPGVKVRLFSEDSHLQTLLWSLMVRRQENKRRLSPSLIYTPYVGSQIRAPGLCVS